MKIKNTSVDSVIVLPYVDSKVLMQLRDIKEGINFPGYWGFFGGAIEEGESPEHAVQRELFEEIGFKSESMHKLGEYNLPDLGNVLIHYYYCEFTSSVDRIHLNEGLDFALVPFEEVMSGKIYSIKEKRYFPLAAPAFTRDIVMRKFLNEIGVYL